MNEESQQSFRHLSSLACLILTSALIAGAQLLPDVTPAPRPQIPAKPKVAVEWVPPAQKITLELDNITVWLGMDERTARNILSEAKFVFVGNDMLFGPDKRIYSVVFQGGKVCSASRSWSMGTRKPLDSVISALKTMAEKNGTSLCLIQPSPLSRPDMICDRIYVSCGERFVLITTGTSNVNGNDVSLDSVTEYIGQCRTD